MKSGLSSKVVYSDFEQIVCVKQLKGNTESETTV